MSPATAPPWPARAVMLPRLTKTVAANRPRSAYVWDTRWVTHDGQIQVWENMTQHKTDYEAVIRTHILGCVAQIIE